MAISYTLCSAENKKHTRVFDSRWRRRATEEHFGRLWLCIQSIGQYLPMYMYLHERCPFVHHAHYSIFPSRANLSISPPNPCAATRGCNNAYTVR